MVNEMNEHYCKRCKHRDQSKFKLSFTDPHVRVTCTKCNRWVNWLKKEDVPFDSILPDETPDYQFKLVVQ